MRYRNMALVVSIACCLVDAAAPESYLFLHSYASICGAPLTGGGLLVAMAKDHIWAFPATSAAMILGCLKGCPASFRRALVMSVVQAGSMILLMLLACAALMIVSGTIGWNWHPLPYLLAMTGLSCCLTSSWMRLVRWCLPDPERLPSAQLAPGVVKT